MLPVLGKQGTDHGRRDCQSDPRGCEGDRKAIETTEKLGGFLSKVFGSTLIELGTTLHDWARMFRYQNLLRIQDKVESIHSARSLQGKTVPIPPRYAIPLVQRASEEDSESLQDMWAGLIANATDPTRQLDMNKIFIDVLSSMEPLDVQSLRFMSAQGWLMHRGVPGGGITPTALAEGLGASEARVRLSLQNLHRLGLLIDEFAPPFHELNTTSFGLLLGSPKTTFRLSPLAFDLLKACRGEGE